ncbi:hypothetical protein LguiB_005337 [Lonicera macranthoides]
MRSSKINVTMQGTAGSQSRKNGENKRKNRSRDTDTNGDGVHQSQPLLVWCSSSSEDKVNKKKKPQELIPMTATITKHISITKTITLTTVPENPESKLCLYLCLEKGSDPDGHWYRWCKIDLTSQSSETKTKSKSKSKRMFLPTISYMPIDTPLEFCVVASSDSSPFSMKKHKKLVYAVGGIDKKNDDEETNYEISSSYRPRISSKAFVCNFGSKSLAWEELPPMSSPKTIRFGVVSPCDGKLYTYGDTIERVLEGDVFDPASHSWTSCPPPPSAPSVCVEDYTFDRNRNKLVIFTNSDYVYSFDPTTLLWRSYLHRVHLTPRSHEAVSSSVAVGDTFYKYHLGELYALDKTSPSPSFELVPGLAKKVDSYMRSPECMYESYLSYVGKGKFALVWGGPSFGARSNRDAVFISCLTFWVGVCNRSNRRRILIDQRQEYFADGHFLHDCVAL